MNNITLTYASTTQSIQDWGFTYCTLHLKSRAPSTLLLDTAGGQPEAGPIIPYGAQITLTVAMGDGSTYAFVGKRRDFNGRAYPESPATSMQFEDVWGALGRTIFQHFWQLSDGLGGVTNEYFSRINLFQDIHAGPGTAWKYLSADDQIRQIVDFARAECGIPVQYGDVDPVWNMPVMPCRAVSCAEALQMVMKPMPDMVTKMDYATSPPTIHFKQRQNCTPVTLPYAGSQILGGGAGARHHKQTQIKPRPDLQVPAVVIQYQITGTVDGAAYNDTLIDAYPLGATGLEENALVFPVDLRGPSRTNVKGTLVTEAIDPTSVDFWKEHKPDLGDPNITSLAIVDTTINASSGHPDGITILDGDGATVDLSDYPNKLISGQPANWMIAGDGSPVEAFEVTIRGTLTYTKNTPATSPPTPMHKADKHVVEVRLRLTDAPEGSTTYSITGSSDSGDPIPFGLAYFMWCSINNAPVATAVVDGVTIAAPPSTAPAITNPDNFQWEGEHEIVEKTIYQIITPANVLNLYGGNSDWASMNAVIYGVDIDFFNGRTNIQFGPFKHLQAAEYFEMVMAFRNRLVWDNPNLRNTGQAGSAAATDLGGSSPKENTTHGIPQQPLLTVQYTPPGDSPVMVFLQQDGVNNGGQIYIWSPDGTGAPRTDKPQVQLAQDDLGVNGDGDGRIAKWRFFAVCDSAGNTKHAKFASSEPEDV